MVDIGRDSVNVITIIVQLQMIVVNPIVDHGPCFGKYEGGAKIRPRHNLEQTLAHSKTLAPKVVTQERMNGKVQENAQTLTHVRHGCRVEDNVLTSHIGTMDNHVFQEERRNGHVAIENVKKSSVD